MKYPVLYSFIKQLSPIPEIEWEALEEISTLKTVPKNQIILHAGDQATDIGLIVSGSVRMYYTDDKGKDFNHAFMFEGSIFAGYPSLAKGEPSKFYIESMEELVYLSIPYHQFAPFYDRHPSWDRLGRVALELNYLDKLEREAILLLGDTHDKYQMTIKTYPLLKSRVSQYHIASFIGVTPSALNRIIKKSGI